MDKPMNGLLLKWGTALTGILFIGGIVAAHFAGLEKSRDYTDAQILKLEEKIDAQGENLARLREDIAVVKSLIEAQYEGGSRSRQLPR